MSHEARRLHYLGWPLFPLFLSLSLSHSLSHHLSICLSRITTATHPMRFIYCNFVHSHTILIRSSACIGTSQCEPIIYNYIYMTQLNRGRAMIANKFSRSRSRSHAPPAVRHSALSSYLCAQFLMNHLFCVRVVVLRSRGFKCHIYRVRVPRVPGPVLLFIGSLFFCSVQPTTHQKYIMCIYIKYKYRYTHTSRL